MATLCAEWTCPSLAKASESCPAEEPTAPRTPCRRPLPSLSPTSVVPSCVSERAQAMRALAAVDKLRVVRGRRARGGASGGNGETFTIELFASDARGPARRIPLAASARLPQVSSPSSRASGSSSASPSPQSSPQSSPRPSTPTLTVERRLAQFSDLRNALYLSVLGAHVRQPFCPYCREIINYSIWGNRVPSGLGARLLLLRDREETRLLALLESFAAELLERTLHAGRPDAPPSAPGGGFCRAQAEVPVLVHDFLFGQQPPHH